MNTMPNTNKTFRRRGEMRKFYLSSIVHPKTKVTLCMRILYTIFHENPIPYFAIARSHFVLTHYVSHFSLLFRNTFTVGPSLVARRITLRDVMIRVSFLSVLLKNLVARRNIKNSFRKRTIPKRKRPSMLACWRIAFPWAVRHVLPWEKVLFGMTGMEKQARMPWIAVVFSLRSIPWELDADRQCCGKRRRHQPMLRVPSHGFRNKRLLLRI